MSQKNFIKKSTFIAFFITCFFVAFSQRVVTLDLDITWNKSDNSKGEILKILNGVEVPGWPNADSYYTSINTSPAQVESMVLTATQTEIVDVTENVKKLITNTEFLTSADITEMRGKYSLNASVFPVRKTNDNKIERIIKGQLVVNTVALANGGFRNPLGAQNSILASGDIYKISVQKTGIFKLDRNFFTSKLGMDASKIDPRKIKIYGNRGGRVPEANNASRIDDLAELKIFVSGESDGVFDAGDYVIFYAEGADIWKYTQDRNAFTYDKNIYDDLNYYFIKIDNQNGIRISKSNVNGTPDFETNQYDMLQRLEKDETNLLGSFFATEGTGKEWYGDYFKTNRTQNYSSSFSFVGFDNTQAVEAEMIFAARSKSSSSIQLKIGSKTLTKSALAVNVDDYESTYARKIILNESFIINDNNPEVVLTFPSTSAESEGWLDYMQIGYKKFLNAETNQFPFRNRQSKGANLAAFAISNYTNQVVWDVTNPIEPVEISVNQGKILFNPNNKVHEFVLHKNAETAYEPVAVGKINNQNLHAIDNADMVIVYHPLFKTEATRLKEHREKISSINVEIVETTEVFNEFSSGRVDPGAIRDMSKLLLSQNQNFKYLLLFGDGSYDYKGLVNGLNKESFVPAYETDESFNPISGFPSDDFYSLLGENEGVGLVGSIDIYVGRLPVKTTDEATAVVDKIIHYETSPERFGDWRLRAGYTADDEDGNTHVRDMNEIAVNDETRRPLINEQKVYIDAYKQESTSGEKRYPDANKDINDHIFKGQVTLTYLGHGGPLGWAQERILTVPDIQSWTNINNMPLMITATCSFAAYDDPSVVAPAEYAILNPKGGAIALYSTTRAVYTNSNKDLTNAVHQKILTKKDGKAPTVGYALGEGKNSYSGSSFQENSRKFTLLGDPSMAIAMPKYQVTTLSINGKSTDTIGALEKVIISGAIMDENGKIMTGFNGTIYPTIFDKQANLQTIANDDGATPFDYTAYRNILFKGSASVVAGKWTFSFWVPKNINYKLGNGRISYYATDGNTSDAGGVFTDLVIGGAKNNIVADDLGPEMEIFMNNESFAYGGVTNANPILLLNLSDDFGINVTGNAIGQDITAILDGDKQNVYILNDFFEGSKDNFSEGKVKFPLNNLSTGNHSIVAKAWDIAGNSTEKRTEFVVSDAKNASLNHVLNYPNPFSNNTSFQFEHDMTNTELEIFVDIYTISGKLVKSVSSTKYSTGFRVNDISWDGNDDFGSKLARGLYLYKVKAISKELGLTRESKFEKLIIL